MRPTTSLPVADAGASASPHQGAPARPAGAAERAGAWARVRGVVAPYVVLTKPRVIELLLVTTIPTMLLAEGGWPSLGLVLATLVGGALAAGSANVLNCYIDRDIDQVMNRTRRRPTATGEISPRAALTFGLVLGAVSLTWLWLVVNPVSSLLTAGAILIYVVGYTMILKRRTPQNIVWGGAAGCMPVLIGWSAVTGSVGWPAVLLFGVIFFWTPPHYWPLSMKFRNDYAAAGVPMLPVVAKDTKVAREMIGYTLAMIACSLLLVPAAGMTWVYAVVATALGAWFLWACITLLRRAEDPARGKLRAMSVFHASITYLTLLSVAISVDVFLPF
ncbi:heme o synthase [Cellulomonas sp. DKR-3]|uniref:Protoheme IX farnesyltransferase n=1 Tax=Cellulomonas fulva TaxID=2835530 RepID=A0ABS5U0Z2_9CELL|nr:heme o synthase [Cellulomonas fulva]MBT0995073.1 heme o synthase [Cellulomonas fulva]